VFLQVSWFPRSSLPVLRPETSSLNQACPALVPFKLPLRPETSSVRLFPVSSSLNNPSLLRDFQFFGSGPEFLVLRPLPCTWIPTVSCSPPRFDCLLHRFKQSGFMTRLEAVIISLYEETCDFCVIVSAYAFLNRFDNTSDSEEDGTEVAILSVE